MANCDVNPSRPNIRIEIHNNVMDAMDVDDAKLSEGEEGEIIEESVDFDDIIGEKITYPSRPTQDKQNKKGILHRTGLTNEDLQKQADRAKRFQLADDQPKVAFTNENLESLHASMGITVENEKQVCFDTLHVHGTDKMNSHDVMEYFHKFTPVSVEWVNKISCNVVFQDDVSSAEALFFLSKAIKGMPVDNTDDNSRGRSVLLRNNNGDIKSEEEVPISDVDISIPSGYWRLGVGESKSTLLLRFAMFSDRKSLMSESKKALFRGIFDRNADIESKNPWGDLAKSWNRDRKTEEVAEPVVQPAPQMKHRLGFKRSQTEAFDEPEVEKPVEKTKIPRMRMYADEEEAKIKRKKALEALKRATNPKLKLEKPSNDLRSVIRGGSKTDGAGEQEDGEIDDVTQPHVPQEDDIRQEADLGNKLMNRRLKFTNPVPLTIYRKNDVRQRLDGRSTKQSRFRDEVLKSKRLKSPPPPPQSQSRYSKAEYEDSEEEAYSDDDDLDVKTNSKVTVVIKKPKQPTVASTVWSRVNTSAKASVKDRLHTSNSRSRRTRDSSESSDDSSSDDDDSSRSSNDEKMGVDLSDGEIGRSPLVARPGFRSDAMGEKAEDQKKPLRIEISNDLYKK